MNDLAARQDQIRELLRPIIANPRVVIPGNKSQSGQFALGLHMGARSTSSYTDWRFSTRWRNFTAHYHELWLRSDEDQKLWYLWEMQLHLYALQRTPVNEEEFILLHCDPEETREHAKYKRVPHLHLLPLGEPLKHSHFALKHQTFDGVESFSEVMLWAVQMLKDEVFDVLYPPLR